MAIFTRYADVPASMRYRLDTIYAPHEVETWWNARHGWLDNLRPNTEWQTYEGRERVRRVVDALLTGGA